MRALERRRLMGKASGCLAPFGAAAGASRPARRVSAERIRPVHHYIVMERSCRRSVLKVWPNGIGPGTPCAWGSRAGPARRRAE